MKKNTWPLKPGELANESHPNQPRGVEEDPQGALWLAENPCARPTEHQGGPQDNSVAATQEDPPTRRQDQTNTKAGKVVTHARLRKSANARQDQTSRQLNGRKQKAQCRHHENDHKYAPASRKAQEGLPGQTDPKTHNAGAIIDS